MKVNKIKHQIETSVLPIKGYTAKPDIPKDTNLTEGERLNKFSDELLALFNYKGEMSYHVDKALLYIKEGTIDLKKVFK